MGGELVALPTETVYGLAADALSEQAVKSIFTAKARPAYNPLICHVASARMAERYIDLSETAKTLIDVFWPGPLTLVCKSKPETGIAPSVSAGLETLAVRCPNNQFTRDVIKRLDRPIAAPSANPSGRLSPTTAESVYNALDGRVALVVDDGPTEVGIESTIVAVDGNQLTLLRPGTVTAEELSNATGAVVQDRDEKIISAPGQLESHYAPEAGVLLNQLAAGGHVFIGFGPLDGDFNLSPAGDLQEAARNLFETLRRADAAGSDIIAVAPIPDQGIGIAINDRLKRAAAPRTGSQHD